MIFLVIHSSFSCFNLHLDHRSHLHRHQEISPEELDGVEATLKLINTLAKHVCHSESSILKFKEDLLASAHFVTEDSLGIQHIQ